MTSFLGVPIVSAGEVVGAFYLTDKIGADEFSDADQELIELFAAHAAVAIATAGVHERSRELSVVEERNRLARDLHDAVSQTLFSLTLTAEAAAELIDRDPAAARAQLAEVGRLAAEARAEMRSLVFQLRPADLEADGLVATLRKHVEVLGRVHPARVEMTVRGDGVPDAATQRELYRIAQEALQNALKHSGAGRITLELDLAGVGRRADGDRRRRRVRSDRSGGALPPPRPDGDAGAGAHGRRPARAALAARRGHDGAGGDARWLSRSGC